MMTRKMGIKGFTLVEVLVALTIFSGLMLTLFSSLNAFKASSRRIEDYGNRSGQPGPGLNTLVSDLEQIFILQPPRLIPPDAADADAQKKFSFSAGKDPINWTLFSRLQFASLSPVQFRNKPELPPGITRLSYYVYAHENRLDLYRSDIPVFLFNETVPPSPCTDPVLFRDIRQFELTFFDGQGNEHDHWDSRDETFEFGIPVRVNIKITLGSGDNEKKIISQVALPIERQVKK